MTVLLGQSSFRKKIHVHTTVFQIDYFLQILYWNAQINNYFPILYLQILRNAL